VTANDNLTYAYMLGVQVPGVPPQFLRASSKNRHRAWAGMGVIKYDRVGECIYCGGKWGKLTDEHIVPYGLGGNWILPESSCERCAKITSQTEFEVLRKQLIQVRARLDLPSRKSSLPIEMPLTVQLGDEAKTFFLPKAQHPTLAVFLLYPLPGVLGGNSPERGINVIGHQLYRVGGPPVKETVESLGSKKLTFTQKFVGNEFERMLAKIAFGFAVAQLGLDAVRLSRLRATILGKEDDAGRWVGTGAYHPPASTMLHEVKLFEGGGWLFAKVRLLASMRTPEYIVVILEGDPAYRPELFHGGPLEKVELPGTLTSKIEVEDRVKRKG